MSSTNLDKGDETPTESTSVEQDITTTTDSSSEKQDAVMPIQKGVIIILGVILASIVWYLFADRFSPYTTQARVEAYVVGVAPKISGLIEQVHVKNNQQVEAGQLLFEIDPSHYQIALDKSRSDLENTLNQVNAGDASVDNAKAKLVSAEANQLKAEQDLQRLERLYKDDPGTISVRRVEVSQSNLAQAKAGVNSAKAAIAQAIEQKGGEDKQNNALIKSAQSAVAIAQLDLSNTKIVAKSQGVISNLSADSGQFASAGNPVMTLVAMHDVWINAEFTENNLGHLHVGNPVEILFDALPGQIFNGKIRSIGIGISSGKKASPGSLPSIDNNRDWLRQSQRFPVIIEFNVQQQALLTSHLRVGGQASIVAYTEGHSITRWLGEIHIRVMSWLSYAY